MTTYDVPLFRADDPPTAVAAGESVRDHLNQSQSLVLEQLAKFSHGGTAWDVMIRLNRAGCGMAQNSIVKRARELAVKGFVADTGRTRSGATGRQLIVWEITPSGRRAAE